MSSLNKFENFIQFYFGKYGDHFCRNLSLFVLSMIKTCSCNTTKIALEASVINGNSFDTNDTRLYRFIKNKSFEVSDMLWRCYLKFVFFMLEERKIIQKGKKIYINIDYTSKKDNFLILSASINFFGKSIPIYFSLRIYPKRKGRMSQKTMERAFIKKLKSLLSKKYSFVIVADRGFGKERVFLLCEEFGFDYIIRMAGKLTVLEKNKQYFLEDIKANKDIKLTVRRWNKSFRTIVSRKDDKIWHIFTSLKDENYCFIKEKYEDRFKIEKCFQDQKSSGFCMENSKIDSYDRFKRMLFCICLAQTFILLMGDFIENKKHPIKKNYPQYINLITVFSNWEEELLKNYLTTV